MDSDADTIWAKAPIGDNYSTFTDDGYILVSTRSTFTKYDLDGNQIWQKDIGNIKSLTQTVDGNYAFIQGNLITYSSCNISLTDTSGNIISQIPFENSGEFISSTNDGGLIFCGWVKNLYTWLLKTDSGLNYTAINLKEPLDGANLNIFSEYSINWEANNINYVNLDYSTDNLNTWNNIINYYPAETRDF